MDVLHKVNFLASTYQPKYQTASSLILSLICQMITVTFGIYTCYSELLTRKVSSIANMGMQKYEKEIFNETIEIKIKFNINLNIFTCNYFYIDSNNEKYTYFTLNDTSINQNISISNRNMDGYFYTLKLYAHCNIDIYQNQYTNIEYNVTFEYDVTRADYLNPENPYRREKISKTYFVFLKDRNEKNPNNFDNLKSLKMNEFKFDYVYYRLLDDLNWIQSSYNNEEYVHNLEKVTRIESYKSTPTEKKENLLFFKFIVDHNDSEVVLIKRKFLKISEVSSKILGIFSLLKLISKVFLQFFYYYSKKIFLLNLIFETKVFSAKTDEVTLLDSSPNNITYEFRKKSINSETKIKKTKKFNYIDNIRFCSCIKSRYMKLEYNLMKSVTKKLKESSSLPSVIFSLFLIKNNFDFCYEPKLKIYSNINTFSMKYNKFDGSTHLMEEDDFKIKNFHNKKNLT
jgi:hypothetical protein